MPISSAGKIFIVCRLFPVEKRTVQGKLHRTSSMNFMACIYYYQRGGFGFALASRSKPGTPQYQPPHGGGGGGHGGFGAQL